MSCGWEMVVLGELGNLQCFLWGRNQTEDSALCQSCSTEWWQTV